ncbi:TPA: hypothetical protein VDB83_001163 [Burkholderia cenocepacia]|uniref:hypothetical protein n=1 Tax=Burkholderia cenocepacia TaxID=95486 RepID=UPI001B9DD22F|nr:hypothetical protein [Burkholderia cenocepacia]MBR8096323.1 hypothetical protein [Burkholderia cenocepacia]HEP6426892.1 hypothetical protein [Burkholderia cenocepacia]
MASKDTAAAPENSAPAFVLVVIHPFGDRQRGDRIETPDEIAEILAGENAHFCNRVAL